VINEEGENIGEMSRDEALSMARSKDLDLIEIAPNAKPPVCKILDWGKFQYQQEKEAKKQKSSSKKSELKEMRLSFKIAENDLKNKLNQVSKFLDSGSKVKIMMRLRGREKAFKFEAKGKLADYVKLLGEDVVKEGDIQALGGNIIVTVYKTIKA